MLLGCTSYILSPVIWYFLCICDYFYIPIVWYKLIPAVARSKTKVCGRRLLGSRVRIPLTGRRFSLVFAVSGVGSVLCGVLITLAEESYRVCVCVILKPQQRGGLDPNWAVATKKTSTLHIYPRN